MSGKASGINNKRFSIARTRGRGLCGIHFLLSLVIRYHTLFQMSIVFDNHTHFIYVSEYVPFGMGIGFV